MLLAADIGNSSISLGVFDISGTNRNMLCSFKLSTRNYNVDECEILISNFLSYKNISEISDSAVSSVVPSLTPVVTQALRNLTDKEPFIIGTGIKTGFDIRIKKPEELGADIVANTAYAAYNYPRTNTVILDVGTATTLSVLNEHSEFLGTIISPGIKLSFDALSLSAAQIDDVSFYTDADYLIGRTSEESLRSGVLNGQAFMIDGFVRNIRENELVGADKPKLTLLATGGLAEYVLPRMRNKFTYIRDMTLEGLVLLYKINRKLPL